MLFSLQTLIIPAIYTLRFQVLFLAGRNHNGSCKKFRMRQTHSVGQSFPISATPLRIQSITGSQPALQGGFTFKVFGMVQDLNLGINSGPYYVQP